MKRKKNQFYWYLALTIYSCSSDDTTTSSPRQQSAAVQSAAVQSMDTIYPQNESLLQNYVRIDKVNQQYYMDYQNPASLGTQSTTELAQQLAEIDPKNKKRFEKRLDYLNSKIRQAIQDQDQGIYLETRSEKYFSDNDGSIAIMTIPNDQKIGTTYFFENKTSYQDLFYVDTNKLNSSLFVGTADYDEPIQITMKMSHSVAGKGKMRKIFFTSSLKTMNAVINWTNQTQGYYGAKYPYPLLIEKDQNSSGYVTFSREHVGL